MIFCGDTRCVFNGKRQLEIILSFYCYRAKLVVEIDGSQHFADDEMIYDQQRTEYLETVGLQVLRISNRQIDEEFKAVCEHIDTIVKNSLSHG